MRSTEPIVVLARNDGGPGGLHMSMTTTAARPLHVLIVEDDDAQARMLQKSLASRGHATSYIASRGDDPTIGMIVVDVAVVDLSLPGRSGVEVARSLHERDIPVLVLSASAHSAVVTEALLAGALGYVVKGARLVDVVASVECVAGGEQVLPKHPRSASTEGNATPSTNASTAPAATPSSRSRS